MYGINGKHTYIENMLSIEFCLRLFLTTICYDLMFYKSTVLAVFLRLIPKALSETFRRSEPFDNSLSSIERTGQYLLNDPTCTIPEFNIDNLISFGLVDSF